MLTSWFDAILTFTGLSDMQFVLFTTSFVFVAITTVNALHQVKRETLLKILRIYIAQGKSVAYIEREITRLKAQDPISVMAFHRKLNIEYNERNRR